MFCFTADAIVAAFERHAPELLAAARRALESSQVAGKTIQFDLHTFGLQPDISIDYAVMEPADNVHVVPAKFSWSDVGSWPALANALTPDASGNTMPANVVAIDTTGTHVQVDSHSARSWWPRWACTTWSSSTRPTRCWSRTRTAPRR
jgi:mannose-1-phosphate guanylyltransferase/mannose-6-phosphate isomerase